jgi:uncharacterized membrane protein YphA (DoxX/SURF4 family)
MAMNVLLLVIRLAMALVWLYNGLWLKVIAQNAHHLAIVESVFGEGLRARAALTAIGLAETLLAIGIATGLAARFVNATQIVVLLAMNAVGIVFAHGEIAQPAGLLIQNLPLFCCAALIIVQGPGPYTLGRRG